MGDKPEKRPPAEWSDDHGKYFYHCPHTMRAVLRTARYALATSGRMPGYPFEQQIIKAFQNGCPGPLREREQVCWYDDSPSRPPRLAWRQMTQVTPFAFLSEPSTTSARGMAWTSCLQHEEVAKITARVVRVSQM